MRRLLWKELRERRLMLLVLVASTSGLIAFGNYHVMLNSVDSAWIFLSVFAALCLGAGTYSSELAGGAADFARSRPISWKSMLAAKLLVGLGFVLVATLLMALTFRMVCPAQYLRFANPIDLAPSLAQAFGMMGTAYLLGFVCSIALPSTMGGVAVVFLVWFSCLLEIMYYQLHELVIISGWSLSLRFVGAGVATVLISRFGLTLPTGWRTARLSVIVLVFAIVGIPLNFTVPDSSFSKRSRDMSVSLSPTGKYAAVTSRETARAAQPRTYLVRIADGRRAALGLANDDILASSVYWYKNTVATSNGGVFRVGRMDSSGRLRAITIRAEGSGSAATPIRQTPAGRYIMRAPLYANGARTPVTVVDLDKMRELRVSLGPDINDYWWQSDTEIGYLDRTGFHIARVPQ